MKALWFAPLLLLTLAQSPAPPDKTDKAPALTDVQRLSIQNIAQRIEIAQLKAREAQREFDTAREELSKLVVGLKVEGYTLDLQTLTYTKTPPPVPPKDPK